METLNRLNLNDLITASREDTGEDEPAPKRKKVMSRAARAWRRWVCGGLLKGALQKHIHILFGA